MKIFEFKKKFNVLNKCKKEINPYSQNSLNESNEYNKLVEK